MKTEEFMYLQNMSLEKKLTYAKDLLSKNLARHDFHIHFRTADAGSELLEKLCPNVPITFDLHSEDYIILPEIITVEQFTKRRYLHQGCEDYHGKFKRLRPLMFFTKENIENALNHKELV